MNAALREVDALDVNGIPAPCPRRRAIYAAQLLDAHQSLREIWQDGRYSRVRFALKDKRLLEALAEALDEYVIVGVAADLGRCRDLLYGSRPEGDPVNVGRFLAGDLPLIEPQSLREKISAKQAESGYKTRAQAEAAYDAYFDWFINPDAVATPQGNLTGVAAFYARYPMIRHAVQTVTDNFVSNIHLACDRLLTDWSVIGTAFFDSEHLPAQLVSIEPTGSDFHKGGKQVLILMFDTDSGSDRLVYKP